MQVPPGVLGVNVNVIGPVIAGVKVAAAFEAFTFEKAPDPAGALQVALLAAPNKAPDKFIEAPAQIL